MWVSFPFPLMFLCFCSCVWFIFRSYPFSVQFFFGFRNEYGYKIFHWLFNLLLSTIHLSTRIWVFMCILLYLFLISINFLLFYMSNQSYHGSLKCIHRKLRIVCVFFWFSFRSTKNVEWIEKNWRRNQLIQTFPYCFKTKSRSFISLFSRMDINYYDLTSFFVHSRVSHLRRIVIVL